MNRTYLLVLLLGASLFAPAQTVVPPYNPDANGDSAIGAPDLLGLLPLFGTYFTPAEVMVDGQTLTEYIDALEEAAANANSDTVTIPMMPGTAPGQMLYWDGTDWTLVPVGQPGDALLLDGMVPEWRRLKTGCPDSLYLEYDPMATVDDGSCITLVVSGCTSPQYYEFEVEANVDDGSCATLDTTGCVPTVFDGHTYDVVEIGDQCWFAENLRTTTYRNGDVIPVGLTDGDWTSTSAGATAVYGEGSSGCYNYSPDIDACDEEQSLAEYGRLYNWYAVDDARGLCPVGWHVPTDEEWTDLEDFITAQGFSGTVGTALKSTYGWYNGVNGTDDFWFSALPGGYRNFSLGYFTNAGDDGNWWSSSLSGGDAWFRSLSPYNPVLYRANGNPRFGFSARCLRDAD
jgi:uncharacterized protein (TIGR02145 family)